MRVSGAVLIFINLILQKKINKTVLYLLRHFFRGGFAEYKTLNLRQFKIKQRYFYKLI